MKNNNKTNEQLIIEIEKLNSKIADLEKLKSKHNQPLDNILESEQNFKILVESARDAIIVIQNDLIKFANPHAKKIYGASQDIITGQPFIKFVHPDSLEMVKKRYTDWRSGKKVPNYFQVDLIDSTKDKRICEISSSTIMIDDQPSELVIIHDITERKQIELALQKSEKKFSSIVESSPMGMHLYSLNQDGKLIFKGSNPAADIILGVDNSLFIGKTIEEAFPPLAETEVPKKYCLVADKGEPWQTEQIVYEDEKVGGAFEVHAFQTSPGKMVAMFTNITERKRAQENEEKFRKAFQFASIGKGMASPDGRFIDVNKAFSKMLGYSKEMLLKRTWREITHPDDLAQSEKYAKQLFAGAIPSFEFEHRLLHKDGHAIWADVNVVLVKDQNGNPLYMVGDIVDITERKLAEENLRESWEKYRGVFDESVVAIYLFSAQKYFINSNQAGLDLLGYSREELLKMSISDVDANPETVLPAHKKLLAGDSIANYEHQLKRKDGRIITVLNNSKPLIDIDGNITGMQSTLIDITERKQAEEKLLRRNKELELFNEVTVGRELKMLELKKEINELLKKSGKNPKYEIPT